MWSYLAIIGWYLVCTYVVVFSALAGHRTRTDANGVPVVFDHPTGVVHRALEPAHLWLWTNDRG